MTYYKDLMWGTQRGSHFTFKNPATRCSQVGRDGQRCWGQEGHSFTGVSSAMSVWRNQMNIYRGRNLDAPVPETFSWEGEGTYQTSEEEADLLRRLIGAGSDGEQDDPPFAFTSPPRKDDEFEEEARKLALQMRAQEILEEMRTGKRE